MKFKNMKIKITDEVHLKAVCGVLESLGYKEMNYRSKYPSFVCSYSDGEFHALYTNPSFGNFDDINLSDLLRVRDEMVKENAKH